MTNIETIKKMYELFAEGNTDAIHQLFDPEVKWNMMKGFPGGGQYIGVAAIYEKVFAHFKENWADWEATSTRYIDSGDGVFVIDYYEGIYKATGKYVRAEFASEYKMVDNKITEYNQYTDTYLIAQATQ